MMFEYFTYRDLPVIISGLTMTLWGFLPFLNARRAMLELGFSTRVANSRSAALPMIIVGSHTTILGLLIVIFYFQGKFEALNTVLITMPYAGFVEGYFVRKEGNWGKAIFPTVTGFILGGHGLSGLLASAR
ncbi:hypothetical protein F5Y01DRAFT_57214 [Xylaria sp. FL0043]|nr:hypothetical protein F5Y01DRAFT_57214 [Xylaria sp. FL0043]